MTGNRFPSVGVDARFPLPVGTDVRFPSPGVDMEHTAEGVDTRFEGTTYGGETGPTWPAVSGGVMTEVEIGGTLYRVHTFSSDADLVVNDAVDVEYLTRTL